MNKNDVVAYCREIQFTPQEKVVTYEEQERKQIEGYIRHIEKAIAPYGYRIVGRKDEERSITIDVTRTGWDMPAEVAARRVAEREYDSTLAYALDFEIRINWNIEVEMPAQKTGARVFNSPGETII